MMKSEEQGTRLPLPVWMPGGVVIRVMSIASVSEHIGNKIAEGELSPADYWPEIANIYRGQADALERRFVEYRNTVERRQYADGWVDRIRPDSLL